MDPEMCAIVEKLGARCTAIRFKLIHKYDLATSRPEPRKLIGSISRKGYGKSCILLLSEGHNSISYKCSDRIIFRKL